MRFRRNDAHQTTVVPLVVANVTVDCGEDRPIASNTHTITRVEPSPELADDDVSGLDELPVAALYTPILGV